jgi:hypothetical protein
MRTVLSRIRLFIDNLKSLDDIFISNEDGGGREQDSGETERESVCV